jgi:hypothetical protein
MEIANEMSLNRLIARADNDSASNNNNNDNPTLVTVAQNDTSVLNFTLTDSTTTLPTIASGPSRQFLANAEHHVSLCRGANQALRRSEWLVAVMGPTGSGKKFFIIIIILLLLFLLYCIALFSCYACYYVVLCCVMCYAMFVMFVLFSFGICFVLISREEHSVQYSLRLSACFLLLLRRRRCFSSIGSFKIDNDDDAIAAFRA